MSESFPACSCVTCSDEATAMVVIAYDAAAELARCSDGDGNQSDVDTGLVEAVAPGTRLLVHAGTAIAIAPPVAPLVAPPLAPPAEVTA